MLYIDSENSFLNYTFKCLIAICKTLIFSISLNKAYISFYPSRVFCISILVIVSVFHSCDWHFISSWDHWVCFRLFILNKAMISSYLYNDMSFVFIVFSLYFVLFFSSVFCGITSYKFCYRKCCSKGMNFLTALLPFNQPGAPCSWGGHHNDAKLNVDTWSSTIAQNQLEWSSCLSLSLLNNGDYGHAPVVQCSLGLERGLAVKRACCLSKGPKFGFHHMHWVAYNLLFLQL